MSNLASLRISGNRFRVSSITAVLSVMAVGAEEGADSVAEIGKADTDATPAHTQKGKIALKVLIKGI
tara:strand:- start:250 stop:450 length:201 start_codon:yes stop_codon:yes gene_type:complete